MTTSLPSMRDRRLNTTQTALTVYRDLAHFQSSSGMPQGYVVVKHNGLPIDTFYKSRDSETTIVCFHGAVEKDVRIPWLAGAGVTSNTGANRLSISDPTIHLHREVQIGWYAGNKVMPDLHETIRQIIEEVVRKTGAKYLVFLGGSAGGFAALAMSRHFPGSLALPMNPQTSIGRFYERPVEKYVRHAWAGHESLETLPESVIHDLIPEYSSAAGNWIGYIQNRRDVFHIERHMRPFYEAVPEPGTLATFWGDWGSPGDDGHVTPPRPVTASILEGVSAVDGDWGHAFDVLGFEGHSDAEAFAAT